MDTLNSITALFYFSFFRYEKNMRVLSLSERIRFSARRCREFSFFRWTSLQPYHRVEAQFMYKIKCAHYKTAYVL